jgi:hypothetical protein
VPASSRIQPDDARALLFLKEWLLHQLGLARCLRVGGTEFTRFSSERKDDEMPEITARDVNQGTSAHKTGRGARAVTYIETSFRTPELALFLAWTRQGPGRTFTLGGEQWERSLTPRQRLAMATCAALGLKVIQQNPKARSAWAKLAREGHEVWQVIANGHYLGVIVDGVYRSYNELD